MRVLKFIFFFIISIVSFAFEIDSIDFSKEVIAGKTETKVFTINNKSENTYGYKLDIYGDKNVSVSPKTLYIAPNTEKTFTITVNGNKKKGDHIYQLLIDQKMLTETKKVKTNMMFRIKQKYTVI
ncbi:hypothetical protein [Fusobacterium sp. SYSU M8D902]|uniref:hypothetical protein n=1 Tax=Fusobacterium sp. SYSU M8D902 TaxID=3159562 RepID=UPI0032E501D9